MIPFKSYVFTSIIYACADSTMLFSNKYHEKKLPKKYSTLNIFLELISKIFSTMIFSGRITRPIRGAIVRMAPTQSAVAHKKLSGHVLIYGFLGQEGRCLKSSQKDRKYIIYLSTRHISQPWQDSKCVFCFNSLKKQTIFNAHFFQDRIFLVTIWKRNFSLYL